MNILGELSTAYWIDTFLNDDNKYPELEPNSYKINIPKLEEVISVAKGIQAPRVYSWDPEYVNKYLSLLTQQNNLNPIELKQREEVSIILKRLIDSNEITTSEFTSLVLGIIELDNEGEHYAH